MRLTGERTVEGLTFDLRQITAHYRDKLRQARVAAPTTGWGEQYYEDLMNAALDDLTTLHGNSHG